MKRLFTMSRVLVLAAWVAFSVGAAAADFTLELNNAHSETGQQVLYEMNVGMFTQQGTLAAAAERLGELKAEGIDIVWLMPVYPRGSSNSPYAPKTYRDVNPKYGTVDDLAAFVSAAHALGMKVWLDWVPNHTSIEADWVTTHPEYYVTKNGAMVHPNNYPDVYQLNYSNADLVETMNDAMKWWVDRCDVDGFRCDYVSSPQIPASYWTSAIAMLKGYKAGKEIRFLAETDIVEDQTRLKNVGFDYDFAWGFQYRLTVLAGNGNSASALKTQIANLLSTSSNLSFNRMMYLTNHDQNYNDGGKTLTAQYGANRYALTVVTFTLPGIPMVYNGQEIGGNQVLNYFTDTKIQWGNVDKKMNNTLRTLAALKHSQEALSDVAPTANNAPVTWLTTSNPTGVLAYTRKSGESEVLVVINLAASEATATVSGISAGAWSLWLDSSTIGRGTSRSNVNLAAQESMTLESKGYRVYVKGEYAEESDLSDVDDDVLTSLTDDSDCAVFFESTDEADMKVWIWNNANPQFTAASWPGDAMQRLGTTAGGQVVYKYEVTVPEGAALPTNIIFTKNGSADANKVFDGKFVNHGYYIEGNGVATTVIPPTSGVERITVDRAADHAVYDLMGRRVNDTQSLPAGIYIKNGRKFVVR